MFCLERRYKNKYKAFLCETFQIIITSLHSVARKTPNNYRDVRHFYHNSILNRRRSPNIPSIYIYIYIYTILCATHQSQPLSPPADQLIGSVVAVASSTRTLKNDRGHAYFFYRYTTCACMQQQKRMPPPTPPPPQRNV